MSASKLSRRSMLLIPPVAGDVKKIFSDKTKQNDVPDAICLDLEDLIHPKNKLNARESLKECMLHISANETEVLLRVNNDMDLIQDDLKAGIWPGLKAVVLPKVESPAQVQYVDELLSKLETQRGINAGTIKIMVLIETPKGNLYAHEIVSASTRVDTLCVGIVDLTTNEIEIEAARDLYLLERAVVIARVAGVQPYGTIGLHLSQAYKDTDAWQRAAKFGISLGFKGALTAHCGAVSFLNQAFSFDRRSQKL